jgi:alcohol dehydrogenase (NADP+)
MSSSPSEFRGWLGHNPDSVKGQLKWETFTPKPFTANDIDIKISHCGICGSDLHTLRSGWGPTHYPACVGHEIIGEAVRVGDNVTKIKVGDRVGVGAQAFSCLKEDCEECSNGRESYCPNIVGTYNGQYEDGSWSMGGYAEYTRVPAHFALKIPDALKSADAAPMMCGGVTVWSPLTKNGAGPGKRVGIVGIGGLGHFGLLFAKALGCDKVVAISRSRSKEEDAKKMGADEFIATSEDEDWATKNANSLDLIISTVSAPDMPLPGYLQLLRAHGQFIQVGAPEDLLPPIPAFSLIAKGCKIGGSIIGSPGEIEAMLKFAAEKGVKPWINLSSMKEANPRLVDFDANKARYRYVLVNEGHEDHSKL